MAGPDEGARVLLLRPDTSDPLIEEALIRTRGELAAAGLTGEAEVGTGSPSAQARARGADASLTLQRIGDRVRILAAVLESGVFEEQWVDLERESASAEVIAVRAVETLLAAMTRHLKATRPPTPPPAPAQGPPEKDETPGPPPSGRGESPLLTVRVGPSLSVSTVGALAPGVGARLSLALGHAFYFAGADLETSLAPTAAEKSAGSAEVRRSLVVGHVGGVLRLVDSTDLFATLGAGLVRYDIEGLPEPGFVGMSETHDATLGVAGVGVAQWLSQSVGTYLDVRATLCFDAPEVRVAGEPVMTLDSPSFSASAGLLWGAL